MNLQEITNRKWFCDSCNETVGINITMCGTGGDCIQYYVKCAECDAELGHQLCEEIELNVPAITDKKLILKRVVDNFGDINNIYVKRIINLIKRTGGK